MDSVNFPAIKVGNQPSHFAYDPVHQRMYVTTQGGIYAIDPYISSVLGSPIQAGINPQGIAYDSKSQIICH
jgi:DNA-binding beta-propeller fold protein YncE